MPPASAAFKMINQLLAGAYRRSFRRIVFAAKH
jgi:hypothetical protein